MKNKHVCFVITTNLKVKIQILKMHIFKQL